MRIRRVLIASNLHRLTNTTHVVNYVLRSITIPRSRVIMKRPLLSITLRRALPSRRVTHLRQVSTPPLRNTILRSQRTMRRRLHTHRNQTTQAKPIQVHMHNANRYSNRQFNPYKISLHKVPHPRSTYLRRFNTRRPLQYQFNCNKNKRRNRVHTTHTLVIILHRLLHTFRHADTYHALRADRVKYLQLTHSLRTRRKRRTKGRKHISTLYIP